jgi:hypothetical protein
VPARRRYGVITASQFVRQWRHRAKVRGHVVLATCAECRPAVGALGKPCELCHKAPSRLVAQLFPTDQSPPLVAALLVAVCRDCGLRLRTQSILELHEHVQLKTATALLQRALTRPGGDLLRDYLKSIRGTSRHA